jgi:hypothetical protein
MVFRIAQANLSVRTAVSGLVRTPLGMPARSAGGGTAACRPAAGSAFAFRAAADKKAGPDDFRIGR